jgi:hypothetical protein
MKLQGQIKRNRIEMNRKQFILTIAVLVSILFNIGSISDTFRANAKTQVGNVPQSQDERNLDPQLREAIASEKQLTQSLLATILSFVGTVLIFWTLTETRKSNSIAGDTAKKQLRAYLGFNGIVLRCINNGTLCDAIIVMLNNFGQTPALNCLVKARYAVANAHSGKADIQFSDWQSLNSHDSMPSQLIQVPIVLQQDFSPQIIGCVINGFWLYVDIEIDYCDIYRSNYSRTLLATFEPSQVQSGIGGVHEDYGEILTKPNFIPW